MKTNGQKPQLPAFDLERLAKLLQMTQSDQPGEALAAIRKANEYLKRYDLNWPEFFVRLQQSHRQRQQTTQHSQPFDPSDFMGSVRQAMAEVQAEVMAQQQRETVARSWWR